MINELAPDFISEPSSNQEFVPASPRLESYRELRRRYQFQADQDIGIFGKALNALASETVIGEILREISSPRFRDTGYRVTEEDIAKFAGDIDIESARRAAASSDSFAEFLFQTDEIRATEQSRKELFSGGGLGFATGLGLSMFAGAAEAVGLSVLGGAILGPAGAAAGIATRATRMRAAARAAGVALAVDVPLEATRYALDKTMRPTDVMIALGASSSLSAGLGAWKPHLFIRDIERASATAQVRATAQAAEEAGDPKSAEALREIVRLSVRVVEPTEELDRISSLSRKDLMREAKEAGVKTHSKNEQGRSVFRSVKEIRNDLLESRTKGTATPDQVKAQVLREVKDLGRTALVAMAKRVGARETGSTERIIDSIVAARTEAGKSGEIVTVDAPRLPAGLDLRKTVTVRGSKVKLKGTFEKLLWKLGTAKNKDTDQLKEAISILKDRGFDDPKAMAKDFVKKVREAEKVEGKVFVADAGELGTVGASRTLDDGSVVSGFVTKKKVETQIDSDIMGDKAIMIDNQTIVESPAEFVEGIKEEDLIAPIIAPARRTMREPGIGLRERLARGIDNFGGQVTAKFLTPHAYRFLGSKTESVRKFAQVFMPGGRDEYLTRLDVAKVDVDKFVIPMRKAIAKAKEEAWEAGGKLTDIDIIRAVRSGEVFEGPLGDATDAVRKFFRDVKEYGTKRGLPLESIPDDLRYVTRKYNHTSFSKLINAHGSDEVIRIFRDAILDHPDAKARGVTKGKANAVAKRIYEFGNNPDLVRSNAATKTVLEKMKGELKNDGIPEEEVDSFMELISPKINSEPHLSFAKRRIEMNETFVDPKTGVSIDEFFDNDLIQLTSRYVKSIVGGSQTRIGLEKLGFDPGTTTRQDVINKISSGITNEKEKEYVEETIDRVLRELSGMSLYPDSKPKHMRWIYASNAFSQATIGMTLGFAQISELASVVLRNGVRAAFQQMPSLRELLTIYSMGIKELRTGRQGISLNRLEEIDDLGSMLETSFGIAGDYSKGDHFMRVIDDSGFDSDYVKGRVTRYLHYGQAVSFMNPLGVMPMDTMLRRWAGRAAFQNFVNMTFKAGKDGKVKFSNGGWNNSSVRLKQMGLNEDDVARLKKAFERPGAIEYKSGIFGGRVKSFNPDAFKDEYIFQKFGVALRKHVDQTVQRQSYSEMPEFWTTPVGRLLGQYRTFMLVSKTKQLAAGVARGDAIEAANIIAACGLGSQAYILQTHYRAMGMEENDRKAYLDKRLSLEYILSAGVLKSSYSTIFPMLVDSTAHLLGKEPVFDPSMRTTGLGIDPLHGSVPYSVIFERAIPAGRELIGAINGTDELSKQDLRNFQSLLWFTKIPGIDQAVNQFLINPLNIPEKD